MKKKIVVCFLTLLISISIFVTGCGKQKQITSGEYIAGKDDQTCLDGYRAVATSENGYYFLSNSFVYFYDSNSKKTHVLCNKPECAHDGEGCNAYINAMAIRYYERALYYVSCDTIETNEFYLWKMSEDGTFDVLPKKEVINLKKEWAKLEKNLGGIKDMKDIPDAIFVVDPKKERICIQEAHILGIPLIGIVDTNCDPEELDYVIPGNDDAIRAVKLIVSKMADAVIEANQGESLAEETEEASEAEAE